jgi:hypothetical protein
MPSTITRTEQIHSATRVAITSALGTAASVLIFGLVVFAPMLEMYAYASSMGIALCYMPLVVANESISQSVYAKLATAFGILYCTLACGVYYTQVTFIRLGSPSQEALDMLSYKHTGSALFAIDILCYFFMSISVLCLGLSVNDNTLLTRLLVAMGLWGATCVVVPLLPFFYQQDKSGSDAVGVAALSMWSILFLPLMLMVAKHYKQVQDALHKLD